MNKIDSSFLGCESSYNKADIVIFGAPFDSTTSFRPGTRYASRAMRTESTYGMETYSPYLDRDLSDIKVCDIGDLELAFGNSKKAVKDVENIANKILNDGKLPFMIGGEHLLTLGAVKAAAKKYGDLHIIHFDAHADLRQEILGQELSHGTVMRRIWDITGDDKIFQFGIRSGLKEEFTFAQMHLYTNKFNFNNLKDIVKKLSGTPVYFTVDLDVMDPSIFPGTGTPEAGGVTFSELLSAVIEVSKLNIVGMDIVELCPICDQSGSSTVVACKLLREMLLAVSAGYKV